MTVTSGNGPVVVGGLSGGRKGSTQYEPGDWYERLHPDSEERGTIAETILDRIVHNAYEVLIDGKVPIRERNGLRNRSVMPDCA